MNYIIDWQDLIGRNCRVTIEQFGVDDDSEPIRLIPSATPFVTEEDNDEDVLKPIRSTTAKLGVMCSHSDIITITSDVEWRVVLTRDGSVVFRGFLKSEALDMEYSAELEEITYTVIDDLEAAKCWRIDTEPKAIALMSLILYYAKLLTPRDEFIQLRVSRAIFYDKNQDQFGLLESDISTTLWIDTDEKTGIRTGKSYYEVLENIATAVGAQWRTKGTSLFLYSPFSTEYMEVDITGGFLGDGGVYTSETLSDYEWAGTHTCSVVPGHGAVRVNSECSGNPPIAKFDISTFKRIGTYRGKIYVFSKYGNGSMEFAARIPDKIGGNVEVTKSAMQYLFTDACSEESLPAITRGSFVMEEDYWGTPDFSEDKGSTPDDNPKTQYQFTPILYMMQNDGSASVVIHQGGTGIGFEGLIEKMYNWAKTKNFHAIMRMPVLGVVDGAFAIKMRAYLIGGKDQAHTFSPLKYPPFDMMGFETVHAVGMLFTAKFEGKYIHPWKSPSTSPLPFFASFKKPEENKWGFSDKIAPYGTFSSYNVDDFCIDIKQIQSNGVINGTLELICYGAYYMNDQYFTAAVVKTGITEWELRHERTFIQQDKEEEIFSEKIINGMISEKKEITTRITADEELQRHDGSLLDSRTGNATEVHTVETLNWEQDALVFRGSLRENLLWRAMSVYGSPKKLYNIEVRSRGAQPDGLFVLDEIQYSICSISTDFFTGTENIVIYPIIAPTARNEQKSLIRVNIDDFRTRCTAKVVSESQNFPDFNFALVSKKEDGTISYAWRFDNLGHYINQEIILGDEFQDEVALPHPDPDTCMFVTAPSQLEGYEIQCYAGSVPIQKL